METVENAKVLTLESHFESMRLLATIVDKTKADEVFKAIQEYTDVESNPEKKSKAQLNAGKMLIGTLNGQKAITE